MELAWGLVLVLFGGLGWLGQVISAFVPALALRLGLREAEADVDPLFFADTSGEAIWDALVLWTLPVAGILLLLDDPGWAPFGLVGGGMYLYFAGRGILQRLAMQRQGIRIGKPELLKVYYLILTLWGLIGLVTIVMAGKVVLGGP